MKDYTELLKDLDWYGRGDFSGPLHIKSAVAIRALQKRDRVVGEIAEGRRKEVVKLREQVKELEEEKQYIQQLVSEHRDELDSKIEELQEQAMEYDKALQYIADNENFNHWTSMTEGGYAFKERKRIKAMGVKGA